MRGFARLLTCLPTTPALTRPSCRTLLTTRSKFPAYSTKLNSSYHKLSCIALLRSQASLLSHIYFSPLPSSLRSFTTKTSSNMANVDPSDAPLYPPIEPYASGHLRVDDTHEIYYEESGNKEGNPVIFVHGGPGGGCDGRDRRYFDPAAYRIILFDQRGAGRSRPHACLKDNTTWDLVRDMEKLRVHLGVDRWVVFGGSWGSCLGLTYAGSHPNRVKALIMRGIFTFRRSELLFFYQDGASHLFPDYWDMYLEPIPKRERGDLMSAYHRRLTGDNEEEKMRCAKAWSTWECATSRLYVDPNLVEKASGDNWALAFASIECHYFVNGGFYEEDDWVIANAHKLKNIPGTIVQGRYDVVCPARTAWDLHKAWPEAEFHMVDAAGHSAKEPKTSALLVAAADKYRNL